MTEESKLLRFPCVRAPEGQRGNSCRRKNKRTSWQYSLGAEGQEIGHFCGRLNAEVRDALHAGVLGSLLKQIRRLTWNRASLDQSFEKGH